MNNLKNTGNSNTGYRNTGNRNTGNLNTGHFNSGYNNAGYSNSGYRNVGDYNTGSYNTGNYNTGYFNEETPSEILVFGKPCKRETWDKAVKPKFLYFKLTQWVLEENMTDEEKRSYDTYKTTGGYLKEYEYQEAFRKSYYDLSVEERQIQTKQLINLPNFDSEIFKRISGIDINESCKKKMTLEEIQKELGYEVEVIKGE